jgi:hypothetical protein
MAWFEVGVEGTTKHMASNYLRMERAKSVIDLHRKATTNIPESDYQHNLQGDGVKTPQS